MEEINNQLNKLTIYQHNSITIYDIDDHKYIFNIKNDDNIKDDITDIKELYFKGDKYIEYIKDKNFIEIGSDFGLYSIKYSLNANTVYSFEPDRLKFNQLCGNIYINDINNIIPFNYGLSDFECKSTIKRIDNTTEPIFLQTLDS